MLLNNNRNAGNLPVKKKAAHINPEAPGAPEVTKLKRVGHFVQRNLISALLRPYGASYVCPGRTRTVWTQHVRPKSIKQVLKGAPVAPHGLMFGQNEAHRLWEAF